MNIRQYLTKKYEAHPSTMLGTEAKVFGIPYPLRPGWLEQHGDTEITAEMAEALRSRLGQRGGKSAARGITILSSTSAAEGLTAQDKGLPYGIIDPDYARVFTIARALAWSEGYAIAMQGSFTRDLDLVAIPWTNDACEPEHLVRRIETAADLKNTTKEPGDKPHGRKAWTLLFKKFADPRFVDLSIVPRSLPAIRPTSAANSTAPMQPTDEPFSERSALESQAQAWFACVGALNKVCPDWMTPNVAAIESAPAAILRMAAPTQAPMQPSYEQIDELLQDHAKGSREMHDFSRSVLALSGGEAIAWLAENQDGSFDAYKDVHSLIDDCRQGFPVYRAAAPAAAVEPVVKAIGPGDWTQHISMPVRVGTNLYAVPQGAAAAPEGLTEDDQWIAEAKKTLERLSAFLQAFDVPHAVNWRDWIDNAEKHFAAPPTPRPQRNGSHEHQSHPTRAD